MKLFKNVDLCDLESILKKGILSLSESGNNNWIDGKRAENSSDVVYLFAPIQGGCSSFPKYGAALLEVECDAEESQFDDEDAHKGQYLEYTTPKVTPDQIKRVIIPEVFRWRVSLPECVLKRVEWCGMSAKIWKDGAEQEAGKEVLDRFTETAPIWSADEFNFFRGIDEKNHMIDLEQVDYIF